MREYVLDANAVFRYLTKGPGVERLDLLLARVRRNEAHLSISVVNRGEVLYLLARRTGLEIALQTLRSVSKYIESMEVTEESAEVAAALKFTYKLGYADCYAASLAMSRNATLVTADADFARLGKRLKVLALPRRSA